MVKGTRHVAQQNHIAHSTQGSSGELINTNIRSYDHTKDVICDTILVPVDLVQAERETGKARLNSLSTWPTHSDLQRSGLQEPCKKTAGEVLDETQCENSRGSSKRSGAKRSRMRALVTSTGCW